MDALRYEINKGVNRAIEFKGLRGQYIYFMAVGLALLLILFAVGYIAGVPVFLLLPLVALVGSGLLVTIYRLSSKYGQHGLGKAMASRQVPAAILSRSRKPLRSLIIEGATNEKHENS